MHHFYTEIRARKVAVLDQYVKLAKASYDTHLSAYIKVVIRRPLGKLLVCEIIFFYYYYFLVFLLILENNIISKQNILESDINSSGYIKNTRIFGFLIGVF